MQNIANELFEMFALKGSGICPICKCKITEFRDALSATEYKISGMCQECQDKVFEEVSDEEAARRVQDYEEGGPRNPTLMYNVPDHVSYQLEADTAERMVEP